MSEVSVVMGVYNGAHHLARTVQSVLSQDVDLELVVVDDGSHDATARVLDELRTADPRVRVVTQERSGLTRALVAGCSVARGPYIARQDAGDVSRPERFRRQVEVLRKSPSTVMVSTFVATAGLRGDVVGESRVGASELRQGLRASSIATLRGPAHHGSVMFSADAYRRVGGYRPAFVVAQDIDLWLRLVEIGDVDVVEDTLYVAETSPTSITATRRAAQVRYATAAVDAACARRAGRADDEILARLVASQDSNEPTFRPGRWGTASFLYFLGSCHAKSNADLAHQYFREAVAACPWHVRSIAALCLQRIRG